MATIDEIKQQAEAVKNASHVGENTALRVGGVLVDLCEWMKNLSGNAGNGGGGTSGGSGVSLGTLLTKLNTDNPFPTDNGQVLTYDGSNFVWKTSTGSGGSGVTLSTVMSAMNDQLGKTSYGTPQFLYWDGSTYTWKNESEISGGASGSIQVTDVSDSGENNNWISATKLRFRSIAGTKPTIREIPSEGYVDVGIPVGGVGGSSGTTAGKLYFSKDTESDREAYWNGESNFRIIFGSGLNVTWDSHSQITLSASGGSGGSTSTSVSWSDVTNKPSTFTPSSHTHSTSDINGLSNYVQGIKVNNATNADKAKQLANPRLIWGQSFNGTGDINGNLKMGSSGGGSIQLWMNDGNMLDRTDNTLHIGYGLKESSDGEINLDANITKIYTDNYSKHYDFKSNVFDVNSNQIHFGSEANGGTLSWDSANKCFKINGSVYATGGITALGVSNNATTSNNVDFTFKSVTITGNNNVQLTDDGLQVSKLGDMGAWYKKDSIIMYNSVEDDSCEIFKFDNSTLTFDPNSYRFNIKFNSAIECTSDENELFVGNNGSKGYIKFSAGSTMTFNYNNKIYSFNVAKGIEQGILTIV